MQTNSTSSKMSYFRFQSSPFVEHRLSSCALYTRYFICLLFAIKEKEEPLTLGLIQPWMLHDFINEGEEEPGAASGVSERNQS